MLALVKIIRHLVVHIESRVYIHCVLLFFLFRFCCCSAHFSPPRSIRSPFSFPIHCLKEQLSKVFFCSKSTHRKRNFCIGYVCTMYIYSLNQSRAADQTKKKISARLWLFLFLSLSSLISICESQNPCSAIRSPSLHHQCQTSTESSSTEHLFLEDSVFHSKSQMQHTRSRFL